MLDDVHVSKFFDFLNVGVLWVIMVAVAVDRVVLPGDNIRELTDSKVIAS